tara:strand:- start:1077 stop:1235 length:159 start_codon:yes stop_codon:yes gene_type:complete
MDETGFLKADTFSTQQEDSNPVKIVNFPAHPNDIQKPNPILGMRVTFTLQNN